MKFAAVQIESKVKSVLLGIIFFLVNGYIFFLYSINFAPLFLAVILLVYAKFLRRMESLPSYLDLSLLGAIAIAICLVTVITLRHEGYWIPAIGFVMLVTMLFDNLELSLLCAIFISFVGASIDGGDFNVGMSLLCASLASAMFCFRVRRRSQLIRAGIFAGLIQFVIAFVMEQGFDLFTHPENYVTLFRICFFNGAISAGLVLFCLPIFEHLFKVVTNISLLELSDFNHPILRRLILEAPGTYQHSLVVANLSETAAEAIGVNSLLARVGAYYHDIGKMEKPDYFVENQVSYRDVHKDLKPSMSKLIILNHVKEGVEMAKKERINPRIIDFILQHHGKTLIYYFYQRAKQLEPDGNHEEEYRYPGPKPQSKEIAIVCLADTIEALSRTVEEPTPSRIEEMVREVMKKRFMEGELDESDLTLRDLEKITQSFIRMLNATFHTRINYPKDEDRNNKSAEFKKNKS